MLPVDRRRRDKMNRGQEEKAIITCDSIHFVSPLGAKNCHDSTLILLNRTDFLSSARANTKHGNAFLAMTNRSNNGASKLNEVKTRFFHQRPVHIFYLGCIMRVHPVTWEDRQWKWQKKMRNGVSGDKSKAKLSYLYEGHCVCSSCLSASDTKGMQMLFRFYPRSIWVKQWSVCVCVPSRQNTSSCCKYILKSVKVSGPCNSHLPLFWAYVGSVFLLSTLEGAVQSVKRFWLILQIINESE